MDVRPLALALLAAVAPRPALGQRTSLVVRPEAPDAAYTARYSQAVLIEAQLTLDGEPVNGPAYGDPELRVAFTLAPLDAPDDGFVFADPVVNGEGIALARLEIVDGRYGGQTFAGAGTVAADGKEYVITAEFLGKNPPPLVECQAQDAGPTPVNDAGVATRLCASQDDGALKISLELPSLVLDEVGEIELGETVTLVATLLDLNGDAPVGGTEIDGDAELPIGDQTISFFFDLDGNGSPSLAERLGTSVTDENGIATFDFTADPQFINAGELQNGLAVQYGGDDRRFAVAGDSSRVNVLAGAPVADKTIVEVDPTQLAADGFSIVTVTIKLVDDDSGILDINAPDYDVGITTTLGTVLDEPERDPVTGFYVAEIRAPRAGGVADIAVTVEGEPAPLAHVEFVKEGCACATTDAPPPAALLALGALVLARRRRR